jgi:hypothetical protein
MPNYLPHNVRAFVLVKYKLFFSFKHDPIGLWNFMVERARIADEWRRVVRRRARRAAWRRNRKLRFEEQAGEDGDACTAAFDLVRLKNASQKAPRVARFKSLDPLEDKSALRHHREILQRRAAARKLSSMAQLTKAERAAAIALARDLKYEARAFAAPDLEEQGFAKLASVAVAAILSAVAVGKVSRGLKGLRALGTHVESFARGVAKAWESLRKKSFLMASAALVFWLFKTVSRNCEGGMSSFLSVCSWLSLVIPGLAWLNCLQDNKPEAFEEQAGVGKPLSAILLAVLVGQGVRNRARLPMWAIKELGAGLSGVDKVARADEPITTFLEVVQGALNVVLRMFGKRVDFVRRHKTSLAQWYASVDAFSALYRTSKIDMDPVNIDTLMRLTAEGWEHKKRWRDVNDVNREIVRHLDLLNTMALPIRGAISARNNYRMEPLLMGLIGAPGIGKSKLTVAMAAALLKLGGILPEDADINDVAAQMFQKGPSKFWAGYCGQAILITDDAFQEKSTVAMKENDYYMLIRAISCWSMPLDMADLESKGRIFFNSKAVILSTNLESIAAEAANLVTCVEAVARRLRNSVKLFLKPEYALTTGFLDVVKFDAEFAKCRDKVGMDAYPWYMWDVAAHNFLTGETSNHRYPLRDYVERCCNEMRSKIANHGQDISTMSSFVDALCAKPRVQEQSGDESSCDKYDELDPDFESYVKAVPVPAEALHARVARLASRLWKGLCTQHLKTLDCVQKALDHTFKCAAGTFCAVPPLTVLAFIGAFVVLKAALSALFEAIGGVARTLGVFKNARIEEQVGELKCTSDAVAPKVPQHPDDVVPYKLYRNMYKMYLVAYNDDDEVMKTDMIGHCVAISSGVCIHPRHYVNFVAKRVIPTARSYVRFVSTANPELHREIPHGRWVTMTKAAFDYLDTDLIMVNYEPYIIARKEVRKYWIAESSLRNIGNSSVTIDVARAESAQIEHVRFVSKVGVHLKPYAYDVDGVEKSVSRHLEYFAPMRQGDCGGIVCLEDTSRSGGAVALGIHFGANPGIGRGIAAVVTQEMVARGLDHFKAIRDDFEEDAKRQGFELQTGGDERLNTGSFMLLGASSSAVSSPVQTKLVRNHITFERFGENHKRPAMLRPFVGEDGERIYPMAKALHKYAQLDVGADVQNLDVVTHIAMSRFTALTRASTRRLLSFEEGVQGVPELEIRSVTRGTSPGFPYVLDSHGVGKSDFFGTSDTFDLTTPRAIALRARVENVIAEAANGVRLAHVYRDFLKDETRKHAKVDVGDTRLISSAALDYVIAWRMYFGAFQSAVFKTRVDSGMAPGVNPYSEWDRVAYNMQLHGDKCFDGDFAAYDAGESPEVHDALLRYINRWYDDGPENARIREVLWRDLVNSRHLGGLEPLCDTLYVWTKGMPSGHPFTTIVNSMYCLVVLVSAYQYTTGTVSDFWQKCHAITYGDDNIVNVDDSVAPVYNQATVANAVKRLFGYEYTSSQKDGTLRSTVPLASLSFLKRGFRLEGDRWYAPLELDSCLRSTYWTKARGRAQQIAQTADDLDAAQRELSLHPVEVWDRYMPIIEAIRAEIGVTPALPVDRVATRDHVSHMDSPW